MLAEFCPAMYSLPTEDTIKKSNFPSSSVQLLCKSMSVHSLSAKPAFETASLNRSFPVYLLSTCLSSKERDLAILLQNGCFQCKGGRKKNHSFEFLQCLPLFPAGICFECQETKSVASTSRILKKNIIFIM